MAQPKLKSAAGYDLQPSVMMVQKMIAGLKKKTGRSLQEWIQLAMKEGPSKEKSLREWLKHRRSRRLREEGPHHSSHEISSLGEIDG